MEFKKSMNREESIGIRNPLHHEQFHQVTIGDTDLGAAGGGEIEAEEK
jgi:hypothetical protein